MQSAENKVQFLSMISGDASFRLGGEVSFKPFVFEASDHNSSVTRGVTRVNVGLWAKGRNENRMRWRM